MRTLTVKEAAERLGIKLNTFYGVIRRGEIRHTRINGRMHIALEDVEAYEMDVTELRAQTGNEMLVQHIVRRRLATHLYVDPA